MLKYFIFIVFKLLLLSELTVCDNEIPCTITYAEKTFKNIFGNVSPVSSKNTDSTAEFNTAKGKFRAIFPGTLWCGDGDIAKNEEELGYFRDTDACCRDHDNCEAKIFAGQKDHGLYNIGLFTRSHCSCDEKFYECLKNAHSPIANGIGKTYFNMLKPQCYKEDYPATCKLNELSFSGFKCLEYEDDTTKDKIWQWRDAKMFPGIRNNPFENYPDYSEFP